MRRAWIAIGAVVLVLSSCGGSDADEPAGGDATSGVEEPGAGRESDDTDPCDLLSSDEVADTVGIAVETVTPDTAIFDKCTFDLQTDGSLWIDLTVSEGGGFLHQEYVSRGDREMLAGIGAEAVYVPTFRVVSVHLGDDRYFTLSVSGGFSSLDDPRDELAELAALVDSRL